MAHRATRSSRSSSTATVAPAIGEVTVAAGELFDRVPAAATPHREGDAGEDLVVRQLGAPRPGEELRRRDGAGTAWRLRFELRVEGQRDGGVLGGGVGMGERAADGAAIADLEMTDERCGAGEQRHAFREISRRLDRGLGRGCADPDAPVPPFDAPQLVDASQIDEMVEDGEPQREERHEALATREHLGAVAELGEQGDGLLRGRRRVVLEGRRLHAGVSRSADCARSRSGTSGSTSSSNERNSDESVW